MSSKPTKHLQVSGAPEGFDAKFFAQRFAQRGKAAVIVLRDEARLIAFKRDLAVFSDKISTLVFPAWDCLPYDRVSPSPEVSSERLATLMSLTTRKADVVLTTIAALAQYVPQKEVVRQSLFHLVVNKQVNEQKLRNYLISMGFSQSPTVMEQGDFAIRGGLIDIFAPGEAGPIRLDLFGDVLDSIRRFDPVTQRTIDTLTEYTLLPVSEVILNDASIQQFRQNYRTSFGAAGTDDPLYEAISAGQKFNGSEHWAPYFYEKMGTLWDYVEDADFYFDERATHVLDARWTSIMDQYEARAVAFKNKSSLDTVYKPIAPDDLYISPSVFSQKQANFNNVDLVTLPLPTGAGAIDAGGRLGRDFTTERQDEDVRLFEKLAQFIEAERKSSCVVIASFSQGARERLDNLLLDQGIHGMQHVDNLTGPNNPGELKLVVWPLEQGFKTTDLTVISEQDVLGERMVRAPRRKRRAEDFITESASLSVGDLVVHIDHGIGRYRGLETVTAMNAPHDCLLLEYANNDRLYLPVENIELLSRYGQETALLDRLGGGAWQAKKAKLRERIRDMADKLIRIAAERELRKGTILEAPQDVWERFCARFPYSETDDQLNAIADVVEDLSSGRPMDRLICGDVGFGKTEVALRAAFLAASSGTQVAIIAPTTLLARQHFKSFSERFHGTGIRVRQLSRFVTAKEASETKKAIKDGSVEIVVGTHAVLAKDISFCNLGLLIIDEEQKFGVTHKERLKQIRSDVHVLTLSATPIPRTLQMSLSGVRELSVITTPPVDRLAIRTYVSEFDRVTIREALLRETYRGGQSFFVVPRIADIPEIEEFLREDVPEISFVTAHGQMSPSELDQRMNAFYDNKYNVLLATTIVESGLDIPTANTMIIHHADKFGLAQLYQIRGRVGRSKTRAYAYLTTKPRKPLTASAIKRLRVIGSLDSLGAGFNLASQDLDIRGAGNILGDEQSGNVREVGFELYQEMLEEAIAKMKAGEMEGLSNAGENWSPQINLGVPVLIPETYVTDLDVRLGLYRRLSSLAKKIELEGFAAELIDRFGPLPSEVEMLMRIVRIKGLCRAACIAKLDGGPKGAVVQFYKDKFPRPDGLAEYLQKSNGTAKIRDNKLVVRRDWAQEDRKVKGAYIVVRDLAAIALNKKA